MTNGPNALELPDNHADTTLVVLDAAAKPRILRTISGVADALAFIHARVTHDSLTVQDRFNTLVVAFAQLQQARALLGGSEDEQQTNELRRRQLREANDEIQRLRELVAGAVTNESLGLKLYPLHRLAYTWWQSLGFSHMETHFIGWASGGYLVGKCSCLLGSVRGDDGAPATLQTLLASVDTHTPRHGDHEVRDTPRTREWLVQQLQTRFPGTEHPDWEAGGRRNGYATLRYMTIRVPVTALQPLPTADTANGE